MLFLLLFFCDKPANLTTMSADILWQVPSKLLPTLSRAIYRLPNPQTNKRYNETIHDQPSQQGRGSKHTDLVLQILVEVVDVQEVRPPVGLAALKVASALSLPARSV